MGSFYGDDLAHIHTTDDWAILVEKIEDLQERVLTRQFITFRKLAGAELYRREHEIHRQRLLDAEDVAADLHQIGFQVEIGTRYGSFLLPKARVGIRARKR